MSFGDQKYYRKIEFYVQADRYRSEIYGLMHILKPKPTDKILDVGCGNGWFIRYLRKHGVKYIKGVDCYFNRDKDIVRLDSTQSKYPFKRNTFDKVVFIHSISHIENILHTMTEIKRVMKKGGTLVILSPNPYFLRWYKIHNKIRQYQGDPTVVRHRSAEQLESFLQLHGFKSIKIYYFGRLPFRSDYFSGLLYTPTLANLNRERIFVVGRKI